ncbi:MAG: hypothetical protein QCI82_06475 [Candidatus Thermoplasmatota archaeon]|nr:hypothetical protein [Candidatus Thermoplasmatota archaeon]
MINDTRTYAAVSFAIMFLLLAIPAASNVATGFQTPTREIGEELVINTTVVLDKNEIFKSIRIRSDGHLTIRGVRIEVEEFICREDTTNTSLVIEAGSFIRVSKGVMNIKADSISLNRATLTVDNDTPPAKLGESGRDSSLVLISREEPLKIENTTITVSGQTGAQGDTVTYGSAGGRAYITLQSLGSNEITLDRSEVKALGGKGGDNYNAGMRSGPGGEARIYIVGDSVRVTESPGAIGQSVGLRAQGGDAGSASFEGNQGGFSEISLRATNDIIIYKSDIQSVPGLFTQKTGNPESRLVAKSNKGSFLVDHEKDSDERFISLSRYISSTTIIDAPNMAEFHQVDVGDNIPSPEGSTTIRHFWWAFVRVRDIYGENLDGARVQWYRGDDPVPYPRNGAEYLTDQEGKAEIEVEGRINVDRMKYRFEAEIFGQVRERSEEVLMENFVTKKGSNRNVNINITRIDLNIATINSAPFVNGMTVGGEITIEGVASSRSPVSTMQEVILYEGDRVIANARSTAPEGAPPYSTWTIELDTETEAQGEKSFSLVAKDSLYEVRKDFNLVFDRNAVNHRPVLVSVQVQHSRGVTEPAVRQALDIYVTNQAPVIKVTANAYDRDYQSDIISSGKRITMAMISLKYETGVEFFDKTMVDTDVKKANETGGYFLNFDIDISKQKGTLLDYPEGIYNLTVTLQDDAGFKSVNSWIVFDLAWDYYPKIDLIMENEGLPTLNHVEFVEPTWVLQTVKSDTKTVVFNFTKFSDQDSDLFTQGRSYMDLTVTVFIRKEGGSTETAFGPEKGGIGFSYTFDVKDVTPNDVGKFTVTVVAEDLEGLITEKVYRVTVTHDPPELPTSIVGKIFSVEDLGFGLGAGIIGYAALYFLLLMVFIGLNVLNMMKIKKEKARKLDLIEKMKAEDKKQQKSILDDEVRSGATKTIVAKDGYTPPPPAATLQPSTITVPSAPVKPPITPDKGPEVTAPQTSPPTPAAQPKPIPPPPAAPPAPPVPPVPSKKE